MQQYTDKVSINSNHNHHEVTSLLHNASSNAHHLHVFQTSVHPQDKLTDEDDLRSTLASVAGNILEWYDFAIYGYFSDIIGRNFFPPKQDGTSSIIESFLVFGGAFFVRPIGGIVMGYVGDTFSRKRALEISIFLMAFPTFAMGCLPTFDRVGWWSLLLLICVRLVQGLSVGGQLMSSLVFVVEGHDKKNWGWYGSFAMTAASSGTLLGEMVGNLLRSNFTADQLSNGYWRIPFLCGIFVGFSGLYIKNHVKDHKQEPVTLREHGNEIDNDAYRPLTPLELACSKSLRGSLISVTASVLLWAGGFYIIWVWLTIFMTDLVDPPVPHALIINATCLFFTMVLLFPFAGWLSDIYGRKCIMSCGALGLALFSPGAMVIISEGNLRLVVLTQLGLGICLCLYASPMCAWMVESFPPEARLTSVAIGYNVAMAIAGGLSPSLATWLVRDYGAVAAGYLLSVFAMISLLGLHLAPKHDEYHDR